MINRTVNAVGLKATVQGLTWLDPRDDEAAAAAASIDVASSAESATQLCMYRRQRWLPWIADSSWDDDRHRQGTVQDRWSHTANRHVNNTPHFVSECGESGPIRVVFADSRITAYKLC